MRKADTCLYLSTTADGAPRPGAAGN